ncbi:MAG: hypothetical protein JNK04_21200 [Myxococcales bacterium]|nr:hypothetical protein [Myxococcales bacterium]
MPASVLVTAEPSDATKSGFVTDDGWTVEFERVLLALGDVDLEDTVEGSGACSAYSETHYEKLFDFVAVEREKVGLVYGLGDCSVEYRMRGPSDDALLGSGASDADLVSMRTAGGDPYSSSERVTLRVQGTVSKDDQSKRFDWSFRRSFEVSGCVADDGEPLSAMDLEGEAERTLRIEVRAEELFRVQGNDDAPLIWGSLAFDGMGEDGVVTLDDLASVSRPAEFLSQWPVEGVAEEDLSDPLPTQQLTLMYEHLLPRVTRVVGGAACIAEVRGRR